MATYTVATGDKSIGPIDMIASQVDSIVFTDNVGVVVGIAQTEDVYVTADGRTPSVPAAGASSPCYRIPAGNTLTIQLDKHADTIKIVSAGAAKFSLQQDAAS